MLLSGLIMPSVPFLVQIEAYWQESSFSLTSCLSSVHSAFLQTLLGENMTAIFLKMFT